MLWSFFGSSVLGGFMRNKLAFFGISSLLVFSGFTTQSTAQTAFVDVPSCHWATEAINQISGETSVTPAQNASTAANALRQVFEGMKCADPNWTLQFIQNAPESLRALISSDPLKGFSLPSVMANVSGNTAKVNFKLNITLKNGLSVARTGNAQLIADKKTGWKVVYSSLSALNIPIFPK
jgi:hypothetical protein